MTIKCIWLLMASAAFGAPLAIVNPGFETATLPIGLTEGLMNNIFVGNGSTAGWSPVGPTNGSAFGGSYRETVAGNPFNWSNPVAWWGGQNLGYLQPFPSFPIALTQTLVDTLQSDTTYVLTVEVGRRRFDFGGPGFIYDVQLRAGGNLLASGGALALAVDTHGLHTLTYNSGSAHPLAGQLLEIRLVAPGSNEVYFDNVTLSASSVPEPASMALLSLGAGLLGVRLRQRIA